MPDDLRTTLVQKMVAEGTSDDDIRATLKVFDAQRGSSAAPTFHTTNATDAQGSPTVDPSSWTQSIGRAALGALGVQATPDTIQTVGDSVVGALKGAGHTAESLGRLVSRIPGVGSALTATGNAIGGGAARLAYGSATPPVSAPQAFAAADQATNPTTSAQKVGYGAEQLGEFFVPSDAAEAAASRLAAHLPALTTAPRIVQAGAKFLPEMATEAISDASVGGAQGGNPLVSGAVGATGPLMRAGMEAVVPHLTAAAQQQTEQFLGATKERYKAMAQRLVPSILQRGLSGSRADVLEQAATAAENAGQQIDQAIGQFGLRQVDPSVVIDALETGKDAFRVPATVPAGAPARMVNIEPRAINQLTGLQHTVQQLGPDATVQQLVAVRRAWDSVVDQAGGYSQRTPGGIGLPLADTTEAWAKREGASAIRSLLDQAVPELTPLNKEYSFWKSLQDVLTQTTQRTGPQGPSLIRQGAEVAGAAAGAASGNIGAAVGLGKIAKLANAVFTSPRWRLASAQTKDALATAIMGGNTTQIASVLARIGAAGSAQLTTAGTPPTP